MEIDPSRTRFKRTGIDLQFKQALADILDPALVDALQDYYASIIKKKYKVSAFVTVLHLRLLSLCSRNSFRGCERKRDRSGARKMRQGSEVGPGGGDSVYGRV